MTRRPAGVTALGLSFEIVTVGCAALVLGVFPEVALSTAQRLLLALNTLAGGFAAIGLHHLRAWALLAARAWCGTGAAFAVALFAHSSRPGLVAGITLVAFIGRSTWLLETYVPRVVKPAA
jgi:hypothetical protein